VADRPWWRRLAGVRARTTVAATLIVGAALVITAVGLIMFVRQSLVEQIDAVGYVRAEDVAALARQNTLPADLAVAGDDGHLTQVVDDTGRILASTTALPQGQPIVAFRPSGSQSPARTIKGVPGDNRAFRIVAVRTGTPGGPVTVYVASALEPVDDTVAVLQQGLAVGGPVLLVLVAVTTWAMVGRALRPVDAIGAEVADISGSSLDRRISIPSTDDEISRLASLMNTMLGRLQAAAERQRRFVADASHELRTPLAAARTDLEVALAHPESTDLRETATDLLAANQRMEHLIRDLLFLAKVDEPAPRSPAVLVDLDDIVLLEVARLRGNGNVKVDIGAVCVAAVLGRSDELARAVRNLLDNAERYASSLITVELTGDDGQATLVIQDDGPGIPADDRERIFQRFARLDDARSRDSGGTGLGLAIAKEIIDVHGGTIVVDDAPQGARFVVRLPSA
jgi:signal transduction histidine kinase